MFAHCHESWFFIDALLADNVVLKMDAKVNITLRSIKEEWVNDC